RDISSKYPEFQGYTLGGVLVGCKSLKVNMNTSGYINTFNQERRPLKIDGKKTKSSPIIEDGKCDLNVSFIVEILSNSGIISRELKNLINTHAREWIHSKRISGGNVVSYNPYTTKEEVDGVVKFHANDLSIVYDDAQLDLAIQKISPFYKILKDESKTFEKIYKNEHLKENYKDLDSEEIKLDTFLKICSIKNLSFKDDTTSESIKEGWMCPIPVGFQAISKNFYNSPYSRNSNYPMNFVESIYSVASWIFPNPNSTKYDFTQMFWRYDTENIKSNLFLIKQNINN
ncbi:MAG: type I-F CRISPR-associated protein Csy2, partial [Psittacicella sp.]